MIKVKNFSEVFELVLVVEEIKIHSESLKKPLFNLTGLLQRHPIFSFRK